MCVIIDKEKSKNCSFNKKKKWSVVFEIVLFFNRNINKFVYMLF